MQNIARRVNLFDLLHTKSWEMYKANSSLNLFFANLITKITTIKSTRNKAFKLLADLSLDSQVGVAKEPVSLTRLKRAKKKKNRKEREKR